MYVESCKIFLERSFFPSLPWRRIHGGEGKSKTNDLQKLLKKLQWAYFFLDYLIMIHDRIDKKRTKLIGALLKQWSTFEASVFGSRPLLDLLVVVLVVPLPVCKNLRTYVEEITKCAQVENTEQRIRNFLRITFSTNH